MVISKTPSTFVFDVNESSPGKSSSHTSGGRGDEITGAESFIELAVGASIRFAAPVPVYEPPKRDESIAVRVKLSYDRIGAEFGRHAWIGELHVELTENGKDLASGSGSD